MTVQRKWLYSCNQCIKYTVSIQIKHFRSVSYEIISLTAVYLWMCQHTKVPSPLSLPNGKKKGMKKEKLLKICYPIITPFSQNALLEGNILNPIANSSRNLFDYIILHSVVSTLCFCDLTEFALSVIAVLIDNWSWEKNMVDVQGLKMAVLLWARSKVCRILWAALETEFTLGLNVMGFITLLNLYAVS